MSTKKPRTARNGRFGFEDLCETMPDILEFGIGAPSFNLMAKLKPYLVEATKQRMESEESGYMFQYGALRGDHKYVPALAGFLSHHYKDEVDSDNLMCTAGATNGLMLLTCCLFKWGDYVFVEDPTYFLAIKIFREDLGLNIIPVPTDCYGVNVEALEKLIQQYQNEFNKIDKNHPYTALFYTIPVFNNPTSITLPSERCNSLIKVLRKYNVLAVCDDVYNIINFNSEAPPKRLFSYDRKSDNDYKGHVVSNGSFSKILCPGMRLGWIEAPETVLERLMFSYLISSGGGVNQYTSAIIGTALDMGIITTYIEEVLATYKRKMEVLCNALDTCDARSYMKFQKPVGGYYVWVELELPSGYDAKDFSEYCSKNYKVGVRAGPCFSASGNFKNFIRLTFSYVEEEEIDEGIRKISTALKTINEKNPTK